MCRVSVISVTWFYWVHRSMLSERSLRGGRRGPSRKTPSTSRNERKLGAHPAKTLKRDPHCMGFEVLRAKRGAPANSFSNVNFTVKDISSHRLIQFLSKASTPPIPNGTTSVVADSTLKECSVQKKFTWIRNGTILRIGAIISSPARNGGRIRERTGMRMMRSEKVEMRRVKSGG